MTDLQRSMRIFALRAIHLTDGPIVDGTLRVALRAAFPAVAFTEGDLRDIITSLETDTLIAGTNDDLLGLVWALTPAGKIRAQQL